MPFSAIPVVDATKSIVTGVSWATFTVYTGDVFPDDPFGKVIAPPIESSPCTIVKFIPRVVSESLENAQNATTTSVPAEGGEKLERAEIVNVVLSAKLKETGALFPLILRAVFHRGVVLFA
jgi:hypothetical protein